MTSVLKSSAEKNTACTKQFPLHLFTRKRDPLCTCRVDEA